MMGGQAAPLQGPLCATILLLLSREAEKQINSPLPFTMSNYKVSFLLVMLSQALQVTLNLL